MCVVKLWPEGRRHSDTAGRCRGTVPEHPRWVEAERWTLPPTGQPVWDGGSWSPYDWGWDEVDRDAAADVADGDGDGGAVDDRQKTAHRQPARPDDDVSGAHGRAATALPSPTHCRPPSRRRWPPEPPPRHAAEPGCASGTDPRRRPTSVCRSASSKSYQHWSERRTWYRQTRVAVLPSIDQPRHRQQTQHQDISKSGV